MGQSTRRHTHLVFTLRQAERLFCTAERSDLPPAAQWLRDNARALYNAAGEVQRAARVTNNRRWARLRAFCDGLCQSLSAPLTQEELLRNVRSAQEEAPFTVEELCMLRSAVTRALMLRLAELLPEVCAQCRAYRDGETLAGQLATGGAVRWPKEPLALFRAMELLSQSGNHDAAAALEHHLRAGNTQPRANAYMAREALSRTAQQAGALISTVISLPRMRWNSMTESLSVACAALRQDGVFPRMDEAGRMQYLSAAARLARRARCSEEEVCRAVLSLCDGQQGVQAEAGYYLLEAPEKVLEALHRRPYLRERLKKHKTGLYLAALGALTALFTALGALMMQWFLCIPFAFVAAAWAQRLMQRVCARCFSPRCLVRLRADCLPEGTRALVTVPTVLLNEKHALRMCRQLSVLYLANPDAPVDFLLLSDFTDADGEETVEDENVLRAARDGVRALCSAYGERFFYLHRARAYDRCEGRCIGSERKRGALMMLCRMLLGEETHERLACATVSPEQLRRRYSHIITLDADTFMPAGTPEKLLGAMLHPLQRGRVQVIQPRMLTLPMHVKTHAQQLLGGMSGADGYDLAAAETYQDVFGRGTFMGKGILAVEGFLRATETLPLNRILSHDLIEGELAGSALAGDIACYDGHPRTVDGFLRRAHRWTRGDWQLLSVFRHQKLDLLSRLKIMDNLRQSLTPLMRMAVLLLCALQGLYLPFFLSLLSGWSMHALGEMLLLPAMAFTHLDAIVRALWRMGVSKRRQLEWVTAAQADENELHALRRYLPPLLLGGSMLFFAARHVFWPGFALGVLWLSSPLLMRWLDTECAAAPRLAQDDRAFLLSAARDTLAFFTDNVGSATNHLPPDNVQLEPPRGAAMRTSPTNIGMYLLSLCAAREMNLMDSDDMLRRMEQTLGTLEKLECWHGIPYNWYDLNTLAPLAPRFVSSVDAGNYALCLMAAAQCARTRITGADAALRCVPARLDALRLRMELHRLFDARTQLFHIGYDGQQEKLSEGRYDLMASESILLSYTAIAAGEADEKHWWRLGRVWTRTPDKAMLSWSGTMFEYLMPALLLPAFPGTALCAAQHGCVRTQRRHARGALFGVSESGYAQFDPELNYRYKAFGIPELSLDAAAGGDVLSPYAAALALRCAPEAAVRALRAMRQNGWYGSWGFFEAVDFSRDRAGEVVHSHMAHHQGMALCAICNALCQDYLPRTLMHVPVFAAHLPLLNELPPRRVMNLPRPLRVHRDARPDAPFCMRAENGVPPDAQLLSGGGTSLLTSANGAGYVKHGDIYLTRFHRDCAMLSGPQLYLRDASADLTIALSQGEYTFLSGETQCSVIADDMCIQVRQCVDPLSGAAVWHVAVRNASERHRELLLAGMVEPALETLRADSAHIAFSNLFFTVEKTAPATVTARRRARERDAVRTLHFAALTEQGVPQAQCMNDRALFIGRGGSLLSPRALALENSEFCLTDSVDICMALRFSLEVEPGGEAEAYFVLGEALPASADDCARAFSLADARAQVNKTLLQLDARMLSLCCRVCGAVCFDGWHDGETEENEGVRALWRQGISGDVPLVVLKAHSEDGCGVISQMAHICAYLLENGAQLEMALLLPPENDYEQPLRAFCDTLLMQPALRALHGRTHVLSGADEGSQRALEALCSLKMDAQQPLTGQLERLYPEKALHRAEQAGQLPTLPRLHHWNGLGGFTEEGAYVIAPPEGCITPAPWCHILCNEAFGTLVSEQGILYSYAGNSRLRRVTRVCQDGVTLTPSEEYFIEENGVAWSLTPLPFHNARQRVTYAMGEAVYHSALPDLQATLACFADSELPSSLRLITLRNTGREARRLRLLSAVRFALGEDGRGTWVRAQENWLLAGCPDMDGTAFFHLAGARGTLMCEGVYGAGNGARYLSPQTGGMLGLLSLDVTLAPGQTEAFTVSLGFCAGVQAPSGLMPMLNEGRRRERRTLSAWQERLGQLQFFLPEGDIARFMNGFLPYQVRASRLMMRAGFYQSGGAWGFRDQLQDMLSLVYTEPERVRRHLLLCASRQYLEGDVQHWWHEGGAGVRTRISDDLLFLPYVTARYVQVTGDVQILEEHAGYLRSRELSDHEHDRYETAEETAETGTLMEHCLRAIERVRFGPHGAPCMGSGDWNDGMDRVQGESAWLGFFLILVLRDFAPLCESGVRERLSDRRRALESAMRSAWTGRWFLRAWYPDGKTIGAPDSEVPRIDLISQCFACFAGMPRDWVLQALDEAWRALHDEKQRITLLLSPPFTPGEGAGYIGAYAPGVRENGGQYTHAVPWLMRALLQTGQTERAWEVLEEILPYAHAENPGQARHYRAEPYVLAADIYRTGRGGWTWYTGSAGWLYEVFLRDFLGFDKRGGEVRLAPRVPDSWEECTVLYRYGGSRYQLTAARDVPFVTLDGEHVQGAWVPLRDDGRAHEARFPMEK